jgi:hypothetical protein
MRIFPALLSSFVLVLPVTLVAQPGGADHPPLVADPAARQDDHFTRALRAGLDAISGDRQAGNPGILHATAHWSEAARTAAQQMFDKYGSPQETTPNRLVWHDNRPWKSTAVINEEVVHNFPTPHIDVLEQTIAIDVPADKFGVLAQFDGSITASRTGGELTVRCDREEINFIALNLATDLVAGKLTVEQARQNLTELAQAVKNGQQPAYATGIQFTLPVSSRTGDADHSTDGQNQRVGW